MRQPGTNKPQINPESAFICGFREITVWPAPPRENGFIRAPKNKKYRTNPAANWIIRTARVSKPLGARMDGDSNSSNNGAVLSQARPASEGDRRRTECPESGCYALLVISARLMHERQRTLV